MYLVILFFECVNKVYNVCQWQYLAELVVYLVILFFKCVHQVSVNAVIEIDNHLVL